MLGAMAGRINESHHRSADSHVRAFSANPAKRLRTWLSALLPESAVGTASKCLVFWVTVLASGLAGCATAPPQGTGTTTWPRYTLQAEQTVSLNLPDLQRFDASGLLLMPSGDLLTLNDRGPQLYRIQVQSDGKNANLDPEPDCFTPAQLARLTAQQNGPYDCEGIARDEAGRIYLCEEASRWILRFDPSTKRVERLLIDWSPVQSYFSATDRNASFEGVAVGGGRLYVANERGSPVIIVVDLASLRVIDHFVVHPQEGSLLGTHYSDLCWHEGKLFVLCRQHRSVLQVDPVTRQVLAEYDYRQIEEDLGYTMQHAAFLSLGMMEGLAVSRDTLWLVTDNNGLGRIKAPQDTRPTLIRCRRPDAK